MKFASKIIEHIDSAVYDGVFPSYINIQQFGIAQLAKRIKDDAERVFPAKYKDGEAKYVGVEDDYDVITYHRLLNAATTTSNNRGYGDSANDVRLSIRCAMVVYAKLTKLKLDKDELMLQIQASFPDALTGSDKPENIKTLNINITDIVLNEEQVFNEEYKNVKYFLDPEHTLLKVNYTIESTFSKRCFNTKCPN